MISAQDVQYSYIKKELLLKNELKRGAKSNYVKYTQEWLCYHGFKTTIDQIFGPATEKQVQKFQQSKQLEKTGIVDFKTYQELVKPMLKALTPIPKDYKSYRETLLAYAMQHIEQNPKEIGGENRGPWVRLYMSGNDGRSYLWCAGFVTFLLKQSSHNSNFTMPIKGSWSCDSLAAQAKEKQIFIKKDNQIAKEIIPGYIFLCQKSSTDWTHTGIVLRSDAEVFETIEGNTNDERYRDGDAACSSVRAYKSKDFIKIV